MRQVYDYVIVGGGSAGCVVATRLAQNFPEAKIAIIEAGPSDVNEPTILALSQWPALLNSKFDRIYALEPQKSGNTFAHQDRHIGLGGCSSHNSCIAFIPPDHDFKRWQALGAEHWGPKDVAPFFDRVLSTVMLETARSGNALFEAVLKAAHAYGLPEVVFNSGDFLQNFTRGGANYFLCNKSGDLRHSSAVAYLRAHACPNITLFTETTALKIIFDEHHNAVSVDTTKGRIDALQEIILSAGAFETPKLLLLSGIGAAEQLRSHHISVRVDLPGVGEHLLDHPEAVISFQTKKPIPKLSSQGWEVGLFAKVGSEAIDAPPDLMLHVGNEGFFLHTERLGYPTAEQAFCLTPNVTKAKSLGTVRLRSNNPFDLPRIDFNYLSDPHDIFVLREGIKIARDIVQQSALKEWYQSELAPGPETKTDAAIEHYIRQTHNTVYHPVGTCKMGIDNLAVVNPQLQVYGVNRLRIADASVFVEEMSVNPNLTIYMVGERCAEFIGTSVQDRKNVAPELLSHQIPL